MKREDYYVSIPVFKLVLILLHVPFLIHDSYPGPNETGMYENVLTKAIK